VAAFLPLCAAVAFACLIQGLPIVVLAAPAAAADFLPHRAVYQLTKSAARSGQTATAVTGLMTIEMDEACEGWSLSQRIRMVVTDSMGEDVESDSRYASFETKDGRSLRFSASDWQDGSLVKEVSGTAERPGPDQPGHASFDKPEPESFDLPAGALFSAGFNLELIKYMQPEGEGFHQMTGFDGGNVEGAYTITVFVGKERDSEAKLPDALRDKAGGPLSGRVRSVRVAYFPSGSQTPEPDMEYDMELLPNGVSPMMRLDYTNYQVRADLVEFKEMSRPRCAR